MKRKILSWLLCLCMALSWIPASALAAEEDGQDPAAKVTISGVDTDYDTFAEAWAAATNPANTASDVVITLLKSVTEGNAEREYSNNSSTVKNITVNIPKGLKLTLNKGFSVSPANQTLTINGNPGNSTDAGENGELIVSGVPNNDRAAVEIGSDSEVPAAERSTVNIENCTITATGIPGVAAGDGNIEITNCEITSENNCGTQNWNAAVTVTPNIGVATTLSIIGSTLTGKHGLYIGEGVTATVTDSTITGETGGCGVMLSSSDTPGGDTTLTVKGNSMITAPECGVTIEKGTLDFQGGTIKANASDMSANGYGVHLDGGKNRPAARKAIIGGTIEARQGITSNNSDGGTNEITVNSGADIKAAEYGIWLQGGTAAINDGASITVTNGYSGIRMEDGTAEIQGGEITATGTYSEGVSVHGGTARITGTAKISGEYAGVHAGSSQATANVTIQGGAAIKAAGENAYGLYVEGGTVTVAGNDSLSPAIEADGQYGAGLMVIDGSVSLSGGTYTGAGCAMTASAPVSLADLLADGYGYFREDGSPLTDADLENGMRETKVLVKPQGAGKQTVPMRLSGYVSQTSDNGETATVELHVSSADPADPTKNTELPAAVMDALTVSCISHPNITVSKAQNEWGGGAYWTASVPTGTSAAPAEYEFKAAFAGNETYYPASAVCYVQASNVVFKFKDNTILRPETTEVSLVLITQNLPENSEITVRCTNSSAVTPVKDPEKENTWNVTLPNLEDAQYDFEAVCTAGGDQGSYYTYCQIIVGDGAPILPPAVTNVTKDPTDTNSGVTVTYRDGTVTLTGTIEFPNSVSHIQKRVTLRVTTDRGERTVTIPLYRDDSGVIPMDEPYDCGDGLVLNIDVSGLKVRLAGTGTGTGSGSGSNRPSGGSGSSSSSSGGGGGGSTSSSTSKNPDGSTTTKTENKNTGTVTETTKNPDGSQTKVETKKDGTVTTTETDKSGNKTQTVEKPDGSAVTTISQKDGTSATVTTDASGKVEAQVKLPSAAVSAAKESGEAVTLPIPEVRAARNSESAPTVTVKTGTSGAVKVEIPARNVTAGTVAVLVQADGTETVLKSTVPTADGVAVALPDGATVKIVDNSKTFNDVSSSHWAESAVEFVTAREMFGGTSAETFTPEAPMTRAMLMTVLARYDGTDTNGGSVWYEKGMSWAVEKGVSDGTNPNGRITREQLAAMLWRYSGSPSASGSLDNYTDGASVSGYAREAMSWAVENGVLNGFGDGRLGPQGQATRAQVAQMLKNFVTNQK